MSGSETLSMVEKANALLPKLSFIAEKIRALNIGIAFLIPERESLLSKRQSSVGPKLVGLHLKVY
jgi:hypothetical protein